MTENRPPEAAVVMGAFSVISGLSFLLATLLFGFGVSGLGTDPKLTVDVFSVGFVLLGALGIRLGVHQHRLEDGRAAPRQEARTK